MKISLSRVGDTLVAGVRGDITEAAEEELDDLLGKIEVKRVVFETSRVELINSLGIRSWITFVQTLRRRGVVLEYQKCTTSVVDCCNMHRSFALPGEVISLFVPMHCQKCGNRELQLAAASDIEENAPFPAGSCSVCKANLLVEVDLDTYLAFLWV